MSATVVRMQTNTLLFREVIDMTENPSDKDRLLKKIATKREKVSAYLAKTEPRNSSLITCSIVAGALAAALTAGPGVGGDGFINSVKNVVSFGIPIWQVLCLVATLLSVAAVIANGMLKTNNLTAKIGTARACDTKLERIETMLELGQIDLAQATREYTECLMTIPHI
jgi:hypothetical protein